MMDLIYFHFISHFYFYFYFYFLDLELELVQKIIEGSRIIMSYHISIAYSIHTL